ncbi:MAG: iron-sulfur cluster assembly scaffold protein [Deltaproteobacteria bacterium CG_4_8_14_3_um_filter_45_9]|nr:MAG: iron-sulfur cluster assembly scaffold protein [Deltaproteobacteria bacterium CG_4_8_14_3_um_filter_45_9]
MSQIEETEELGDEVGYLVYNETMIDHFTHPRNAGEIENPDAMAVVGDPTCGDYVRVYINVRDGKISDSKFLTMGCPGAIATSSIATELAIGKTLDEALKLTDNDVIHAAGGIPARKAHCSLLAIRGLHQAILDYQSSLPPSPQSGRGEG